jgi:hypothetical protein
MFIVKTKNKPLVQFHCNGEKPSRTTVDEVVWLSADGDELELIRAQFINLPITNGNYCMWTGELANFVLSNLSTEREKQQRTGEKTK